MNEEVPMSPRHDTKIGKLEYMIHDPHDVIGQIRAGVEGSHDERHVRSGLVIKQHQCSFFYQIPHLKVAMDSLVMIYTYSANYHVLGTFYTSTIQYFILFL